MDRRNSYLLSVESSQDPIVDFVFDLSRPDFDIKVAKPRMNSLVTLLRFLFRYNY